MSVTAPVIQHPAGVGNARVITDGEWLDTYTINSELESSHLYKSSVLLEQVVANRLQTGVFSLCGEHI